MSPNTISSASGDTRGLALHGESWKGLKKGNNPTAEPVFSTGAGGARPEPYNMTSSGLLVYTFLTKLSRTDSMRVA